MQPPSMSGQSLGGETYTSEMNPKLKSKHVPLLAMDTIEDEYCAPPYTHDAAEDVRLSHRRAVLLAGLPAVCACRVQWLHVRACTQP